MRNAVSTSLFGLLGIGLLAGCPDRTISEVNPEQGRVEFKDIPVNLNRNIDILFVIDDSGSMADKQTNLKTNFPNFINVLNTIQGGLPDVHIGVISSDMGTHGENGMNATAVGTVGQGGCANTGDDGRLQLGTATNVTGTFLSDIKLTDGSRQQNYTGGNLSTTFADMASIGATGCGFEQHLSAMKRALDPNNASNSGFVRADAFLAVIFLADEDDCSMQNSQMLGPDGGALGPQQSFRCTRFGIKCDTGGANDTAMNTPDAAGAFKEGCHPDDDSQFLAKVSDYITFLKSRKDDPSKVIVAGIIGLPVADECEGGVCGLTTLAPNNSLAVEIRAINGQMQPALRHSCEFQSQSGQNLADPGIRLASFLSGFPNRNTLTTICQNDQSQGMKQIGELLKAALGNPCIEGDLADVDPVTPGEQFECSASVVTNFGKPNAVEEIIPECATNGGAEPCWVLESDPTNCPNSDNLKFVVNGQENLPPDAHMLVNCVTEVGPSP